MDIDKIKDLGIIKPHGFYTNWFKFDPIGVNEKVEFEISDKKSVPEEFLKEFYAEYEKSFKDGMSRTRFESSKVCTRLVYLSELSNLNDIKSLMRVGIWEISNA